VSINWRKASISCRVACCAATCGWYRRDAGQPKQNPGAQRRAHTRSCLQRQLSVGLLAGGVPDAGQQHQGSQRGRPAVSGSRLVRSGIGRRRRSSSEVDRVRALTRLLRSNRRCRSRGVSPAGACKRSRRVSSRSSGTAAARAAALHRPAERCWPLRAWTRATWLPSRELP
jgi:hypothetical protein